MERYNVTSTQYIVSGFLGRKNYDSPSDVYDFRDAGHEIASHTFDHPDLTTLSAKDLTRELTLPKAGLSKCYGTVTDFAAPYGSYNATITKAASGLYQTARSTDTGFNSADQFHPYQLKVENVRNDTPPERIQTWLDTAKANHVWLILVYHQVDGSGGEYARKPSDFEADLQKIVASGIPVKTMHDAYAEIQPQLKP
jgi:peptidoglycan/xylan/chitin deacetylase (PgdA/CDA1 family)